MRLSHLSDRQLRRLIRNADVRFGDNDITGYKKASKIINSLMMDYTSKMLEATKDKKVRHYTMKEVGDFVRAKRAFYDAWEALENRIAETRKRYLNQK